MYINRLIDNYLVEWRSDPLKKPLLLRGARQVGKSSTVRNFAKNFEKFIEVNFEEHIEIRQFFDQNLTVDVIIEKLSIYFNTQITPGNTLVFFDEIQACPQAISSLRFFYEKKQDLHVIATGSLLEFALEELSSFGVGRIRSIYMYPFSFNEYLMACNMHQLLAEKKKANTDKPIFDVFHSKLNNELKIFMLLGGMPEVIAKYVGTKSVLESQKSLDDIIISLKTDFNKYKKRVPAQRINSVFDSLVNQTGGKFKYASVGTELNHNQVKEAIRLLVLARLIIPITFTNASGLPLGSGIDPKRIKYILLDTGIFQHSLGLNINEFLFDPENKLINKGDMAEMFWALEYLKYSSPYHDQSLYYWSRENKQGNAEIDFVIQTIGKIIPVEIKSSGKGSMQSIRLFMKEKQSEYGIRFSLENFGRYENIKVWPLHSISNLL